MEPALQSRNYTLKMVSLLNLFHSHCCCPWPFFSALSNGDHGYCLGGKILFTQVFWVSFNSHNGTTAQKEGADKIVFWYLHVLAFYDWMMTLWWLFNDYGVISWWLISDFLMTIVWLQTLIQQLHNDLFWLGVDYSCRLLWLEWY